MSSASPYKPPAHTTAMLAMFAYCILLIAAWRKRPYTHKGKLVPVSHNAKADKQRKLYDFIRGWKGRGLLYSACLGSILVVIVIGVGVVQINDGPQKLEAGFGSGGYMSVRAIATGPSLGRGKLINIGSWL
jgi:hypothetical protein